MVLLPPERSAHAVAKAVASGQGADSGRRADWLRPEAAEAHAARGQPVQIRSGGVAFMRPKGADAIDAEIVGQQNQDVRRPGRTCRRSAGRSLRLVASLPASGQQSQDDQTQQPMRPQPQETCGEAARSSLPQITKFRHAPELFCRQPDARGKGSVSPLGRLRLGPFSFRPDCSERTGRKWPGGWRWPARCRRRPRLPAAAASRAGP